MSSPYLNRQCRTLAEVQFTQDQKQRATITEIARRARSLCAKRQVKIGTQLDVEMDIAAAHSNGNPLRLKALLAADEFNLMHDVLGIIRHIDRRTGRLGDFFCPRYSRPESQEGRS